MAGGSTRGRSVFSAGTRAKLIDAARVLFHRDGFESVSVRQIASATEMTTGALYAHFDSKFDVLFAVVAADAGSGIFQPGSRRSADARLRAEALLLTVASLSVQEPRARELLATVLGSITSDAGRSTMTSDDLKRGRLGKDVAVAGEGDRHAMRSAAGDLLLRAAGYRST